MNKLVSIELPTCNKENFEKYVLKNLPLLEPVSKYAKWNINFQKEFTQEDVDRYIPLFSKYGFDISYEFHEYKNKPGFNSIVKFREDTHQIDPSLPLLFSIDDDIEILNNNYTKALLSCILHILQHDEVGGECIEGFMYGRNRGRRLDEIDKCTKVHKYWTDGGLLVKNIKRYNGMFPMECRELLGSHQDYLLIRLRIAEKMVMYRTIAPYYKHYELRNGSMMNSGFYRHGWNLGDMHDDTKRIEPYYKKLPMHDEWYNEQINHRFYYSGYSIDELCTMIDDIIKEKDL